MAFTAAATNSAALANAPPSPPHQFLSLCLSLHPFLIQAVAVPAAQSRWLLSPG